MTADRTWSKVSEPVRQADFESVASLLALILAKLEEIRLALKGQA